MRGTNAQSHSPHNRTIAQSHSPQSHNRTIQTLAAMEASQLELDMRSFVDLHLSFLDFNNTPRRWAEAYDETTRLEQTSTERLFLDTGFSTAKKRHFEGQASCNQLLRSLDELDFETRKTDSADGEGSPAFRLLKQDSRHLGKGGQEPK